MEAFSLLVPVYTFQTSSESYKQFLKNAEDLANQLSRQQPTVDVPVVLHGKIEAIVLFNNLASIPTTTFQCPEDPDEKAKIALALDRVMGDSAPAGWKNDKDGPRQKQVMNALFPIMKRDRIATQAIFEIVANQEGY